MTWDEFVELSAMAAGTDRLELTDLVHRPPWMSDSACREHPEVNWFPGRGEDARAAKAVCSGCLVRLECVEHALTYPLAELHGIWGGESAKSLKRARPRQEPRPARRPPAARPLPTPIVCACGAEVVQPRVGRRRRWCTDCRPAQAA